MAETRAELADLKEHLRGMQAEFANQIADFTRVVVQAMSHAPQQVAVTDVEPPSSASNSGGHADGEGGASSGQSS